MIVSTLLALVAPAVAKNEVSIETIEIAHHGVRLWIHVLHDLDLGDTQLSGVGTPPPWLATFPDHREVGARTVRPPSTRTNRASSTASDRA